ncbi:hypothetical protein HZ326_20662 [Fusarium oxysporum f. sp. albedinis]|nr:hypothetical protein HZ326_20662 [Fusarium oxysporum f. sp. albedinis]
MTGRGPIDAIMVRTVSFLPWSRLGYGSDPCQVQPPAQPDLTHSHSPYSTVRYGCISTCACTMPSSVQWTLSDKQIKPHQQTNLTMWISPSTVSPTVTGEAASTALRRLSGALQGVRTGAGGVMHACPTATSPHLCPEVPL